MRQILLNGKNSSKDKIEVTGDDFHHLYHVRRIKVGEKVKAAFDSGEIGFFEVTSVTVDSVILEKREDNTVVQPGLFYFDDVPTGFGCEIYLLQFMPKMPRFEQILRQSTEIGVSRILPVISRYSPPEHLSDSKRLRLRKIIKEARQQSGSIIPTSVDDGMSLATAMAIVTERGKKYGKENSAYFALSERGGKALHERLQQPKKFISVAVGCEGGFADEEFNFLKENGFEAINFETNIMRVETAAIFGLAAIQTKNLELNSETRTN